MNLQRYRAADLSDLMDRITKNSIGMDTYFDKFFTETITNYPPYNLIQVSNTESRLEIALAGFKKEEVNVYTEYGKLFVEGKKKDDLQSVMKLIEDAKIGIPVQFVNFRD